MKFHIRTTVRFWAIVMLGCALFSGASHLASGGYDAAAWAFNCALWAGMAAETTKELGA